MIKLSPEQASRLEDETVRDEDEGYFVAGVEMWHQLHCLVCLDPFFLSFFLFWLLIPDTGAIEHAAQTYMGRKARSSMDETQ